MITQKWLDRIDESLVKPFYESQNESERQEGFEETLKFGTAGIRSTFELGPGRLNAFTVRKVAYGLAQYLTDRSQDPSIVIHYDTRNLSKEFAEEMASVLAAQGVKTIISDRYRSTPELSFAVRALKTDAGIMITASHNPKHYNGIKVYNHEGGQLLPDASEDLSRWINGIEDPLKVEKGDFDQQLENNQIQYLDPSITNQYKEEVKSLVGGISQQDVKVVLTSLHGTSLPILSDILTELQYNNFVIEKDQSIPDGNFPTVEKANPEEAQAFELGLKLAVEENAGLIIATDPDADRLGFVERYEDGSYRHFNGNEIGLILMKLRYQELVENGNQLYIAKSIVTSELAERFGKALGIDVYNVLTGFKYISDLIASKENTDDTLLLAFEESHGYLAKAMARDKDAIQIVPLLIKYKNLLAEKGLTFRDEIHDIQANLGHFKDRTLSPKFSGKAGKEIIDRIMTNLREHPPHELNHLKVQAVEDYQKGEVEDLKEQTQSELSLPKTNLIRLIFDEGFIALRPSGTEPKIKIYFSLSVEALDPIIDNFYQNYIEKFD